MLRELLREDGSIWVTIDDNDAHYLKVVMDEVFGRGNFLTTFIWKKSYGGGAKARWFVGLHEYVHCYAKNLDNLPDVFLPPIEESFKYYKYKDDKFTARGPYRLQPLATTSNDRRPNLRYPITAPDGRTILPKKQWQWSRDRVATAIKDNEIVFNESRGSVSVSYKQYLRSEDGEERRSKPVTIIDGHFTQHGTYESMELFGLENKFAFPKPEGLLRTVLEAASRTGDLILDSSLGSGTTAAVAQKMGRRYIGIELGAHAVTHCVPRLRKVIDGEQGGISKAVGWQGGGGFRFYRLGAEVFDEAGRIREGIGFGLLAAHVWFSETRTPWPQADGGKQVLRSAQDDPALKSTALEGNEKQILRFAQDDPFLGHDKGLGTREASGTKRTALLGVHEGTAYFLLYNGVLGDKRPRGGNVLTRAVLAELEGLLPEGFAGGWVVYGESARVSAGTLKNLRIVFKQTPYDVRAR